MADVLCDSRTKRLLLDISFQVTGQVPVHRSFVIITLKRKKRSRHLTPWYIDLDMTRFYPSLDFVYFFKPVPYFLSFIY